MYTKVTLQGSYEAVIADIRSIQMNGEPVYPNYPEGYEVMGSNAFDRFVVTPPRQLVVTPAEFDSEGNVTQEAVLGDWQSKLVLPAGYDVSHFTTAL